MMKFFAPLRMTAFLFALLTSINALAQWDLAQHVVEFKLPNGMRWLLVRRPTPSVFAGAVEVKVGGVDELPPKIGLAHMFEHMAFKGTREIGTTDYEKEAPLLTKIAAVGDEWVRTGNKAKFDELQALQKEVRRYQVPNELFTVLARSGARNVNAYTTKDATQYHSEMPSTELPLWLYLYAGMVSDPVLREFYPERDVVQEERRMRVENSPHGKAYQALIATAFTTSPYHYSTIGSAEQISSLSMADAKNFYKTYYHPDRMVGALVGDINIGQAKALITRYFGLLPARPSPKDQLPEEPAQTEMRRTEVAVDSAPFLLMGFHKPRVGTSEDYIFDVIDYILCEGASSRLHKTLVLQDKIAQRVTCANGIPGNRLNNLYYIEAFPSAGHRPKELETRIMVALAQLAAHGVSDDELRKARNNLAANFLWEMNGNGELAELLVTYQALAGDWRYVITHAKHIEAVTNDDVKRVARQFLIPQNATIVTAVQK
jgi:predicted Zn-dependent peptidase